MSFEWARSIVTRLAGVTKRKPAAVRRREQFLAGRIPVSDAVFCEPFPSDWVPIICALRETIARECGVERQFLHLEDQTDAIVTIMNTVASWDLVHHRGSGFYDPLQLVLDLECVLRQEHGLGCRLAPLRLPHFGHPKLSVLGRLVAPRYGQSAPVSLMEWLNQAVPSIFCSLSKELLDST